MPAAGSLPTGLAQFGAQFVQHWLDGVFITAPDGAIHYANPAACELVGYTEEELREGGRELIIDPSDPEIRAILAEREKSGQVRGEMWYRHRDGHRLRVEVSSVIFTLDDGEQRTAIIARDISDQRSQEYEHRLLEVAASAAPLIVSIADEEARILWMNHAAESITGYSSQELVGSVAPVLRYMQESLPNLLDAIWGQLRSEGTWTGQLYSRRKSGEVYPLFGTVSMVEAGGVGQRRLVAALADVSELRNFENRLHRLSSYDPVTGLANRSLFERRADAVLGHRGRDDSESYLCLIDIDGLGAINGTLGFETGDAVLKGVAGRLSDAIGERALLARYTGGSFALLIAGSRGMDGLEAQVERLKSEVRTALNLGSDRLSVTASIGISICPSDGTTVRELLHKAGLALQHTKLEGGDSHAFYVPDLELPSHKFVELTAPMREGLANDEFEAHFQPIVDTASRRIVGMETLARWQRPDGTSVSPADFIPVAERTAMILDISLLMLRQTCAHLRRLDAAGYAGLTASLNLSVQEFRHPGLVDRILSTIGEVGLDPSRILLEITENHLMLRPAEINRVLTVLQRKGMKVVIDDFGTGYSSFAYLRRFHVNGIKLDRYFVRDVPGDAKNEALLSMMIGIGHKLEIPVVAEGVEDEAQAAFLEEHGCSRFQGFLVSPALDSDGFARLMEDSGGVPRSGPAGTDGGG